MFKGVVWFSEMNIHGAWVVYGIDGIKQYYGYTKRQAEKQYKKDCKTFVNERGRVI